MKKFEVSFPYFLEYPIKIVVRKIGLLGFFIWFFQKFSRCLPKKENIIISERIVEIPSVYLLLASFIKGGDKILEIGHVNSAFSLELANLGYKVTAIDIRDYPFQHENLVSIKNDFLKYEFQEKFNCVICVSTLEHFGDNKRYGGDYEKEENLDRTALQKIADILDQNGKFILTVPFAAVKKDYWFKVYTRESLEKLLNGFFNINKKYLFYRKNNQWLEAKSRADDPVSAQDGVAIFLLSKK